MADKILNKKSDNYNNNLNNISKTDINLTKSNHSIVSNNSNTDPNLKLENSLYSQINSKFEGMIKLVYSRPRRIKIYVEPENILSVAEFLKNDIGMDHAESVCGTDYPDENSIEVIYHLNSYSREDLFPLIFALSTKTNRDDARLPSLIRIFNSVEYHERETFEMLGVYFEGHPRNERFLLPEDWADIPPLRKDFHIKGR
jgi:NADH-quinone oxidoreductase subunit C